LLLLATGVDGEIALITGPDELVPVTVNVTLICAVPPDVPPLTMTVPV